MKKDGYWFIPNDVDYDNWEEKGPLPYVEEQLRKSNLDPRNAVVDTYKIKWFKENASMDGPFGFIFVFRRDDWYFEISFNHAEVIARDIVMWQDVWLHLRQRLEDEGMFKAVAGG